jgi:hypothetical protein
MARRGTSSTTATQVLAAMCGRGEALVLGFGDGELVWRLLHSGRRVSARTAQHIINTANVRAADDALFPGAAAQTWRVR